MEASETLRSLSEIAIALAGFTGIVAVLGHRAEGRWDPLEWLQLRMLLETSLGVFFLSLTPLLLQQLEPIQTVLWRLSNSLQASVHVAGVFVLYLRARKLEASQWPREERWLTAALLPVSFVIIGAQVSAVVGALAQYGFFLYLLGLVYLLGLAALHPTIVLMGEAVYLLKDEVVDSTQGVGLPPLRQLVDKVFDHEVPIYV